jgi:hypothetical protein
MKEKDVRHLAELIANGSDIDSHEFKRGHPPMEMVLSKALTTAIDKRVNCRTHAEAVERLACVVAALMEYLGVEYKWRVVRKAKEK